MMLSEPYIRIAVISDLHCQKGDDSVKVTKLHTKLLDNPPNVNPVESFKKIIIDNNKKVDYFFVLGDIADKGNIDGFNLGVKLVKEINTLLNADKLIFAVGNHDMDIQKANHQQNPEYMMKQTNDFPFLFRDKSQLEGKEKKFWADKYCVIEDDKTLILVLNTSCFMKDKDNLKPLVFDNAMEDSLKNELLQYQCPKKLKIAICHHHPVQHCDFDDKYTSLDCIDRGSKLVELLKSNNFTLLMYGHKHLPQLIYERNLPVFCSGSFSSLENTSSIEVGNTIHFLDIFQEGNIFKGTIETWTHSTMEGWKKLSNLELRNRFPSYTGFGSKMEISKIVENIWEIFYKQYEGSDSYEQYITRDKKKISERINDINFLIPIELNKLYDELEKKNITIRADKNAEITLCLKKE